MDKIIEIHEKDGDLVCQAGARWMDINEELKERGIPLFFPLGKLRKISPGLHSDTS